ncbi:MAG: DUF697 domain-containing protein [Cyanobacteria bacterium J083]|nr:MAG: DUF697 domain-containing protein [Cyanobacteria bacterium J083]
MSSSNQAWNFAELDQTIDNFQLIQEELNYNQAQSSLKKLLTNLDLTQQEKTGLEAEIESLSKMLDKLERAVVQIAVFGMVGRGKSSLLNALLGQEVFKTGALHGVTQAVAQADWQWQETDNFQRLTIPGKNETQIQLIDTPGIDEVEGESREILAYEIAKQVDLIIFVVAGDITQVEYRALSQLREVGKPIILAFNKIDQYPRADRLAIYQKIKDERVKELLSPDEIVMVAAAPLEVKGVKDKNGKLTIQRSQASPKIDTLKLKILEILEREGKSLVALNSMLYADEINEKIVQRKMMIRELAANKLIQKGVMTKAVAIALNPVTAIDLFTGAIIDVAIIISLSRLYGIPMTHSAALDLLKKIAICMGGISASELLAMLGLSSLKGMLGLTAPLTAGLSLAPYLSVAITQGAVGGASSYAIAQITKTYLANGAAWGEEAPKTVVSRILESLDEKSIMIRLKEELKQQIRLKKLLIKD